MRQTLTVVIVITSARIAVELQIKVCLADLPFAVPIVRLQDGVLQFSFELCPSSNAQTGFCNFCDWDSAGNVKYYVVLCGFYHFTGAWEMCGVPILPLVRLCRNKDNPTFSFRMPMEIAGLLANCGSVHLRACERSHLCPYILPFACLDEELDWYIIVNLVPLRFLHCHLDLPMAQHDRKLL